ncbi:uncharacterized protein LOC110629125 isoform X4 [Manihot esculenta]|uniref:uncharacterized protein LOC110629125 isoform X4 n=1 Tax=Manihot esculenta TaxID=3983 RepID=UPI001CC35F5B|nr:uncharacterized protein LOC110629125 isoform X4 [Manihot esculenta]
MHPTTQEWRYSILYQQLLLHGPISLCEMDGFSVDENEDAPKKRENGISWPHLHTHVQHRRSKSAFGRKLEVSRGGILHSTKKDHNGTNMSPLSSRAYRTQSPLHDYPTCTNKNISSDHRASLEQDIELLQLRLQEEKSMRMMLERAMGRVSSTLSPGHRHFATQAHEKIPDMEKSPILRTLKNHLCQCPSMLSEEMVRCMAAVYFWLRSTSVSGKNRSPTLSRSSTNVVLPRHGIGEDRGWSCKSMEEISLISTDKSQFSRASYAINNYRVLVEQLEGVNVSQMENNAQTAFWMNVYNALVMHAYLAYGIPHSSLRRLALFHKAAYNIGGHIISANAIEQSIFCFRTPRVGTWLETIFSTTLRKRSSEERKLISSKFGLSDAQPLVCFGLCTGALSDPVLKVYTASNVKEELEVAKREFLQTNIVVKKSRKVFLPKLLERFAKEASINSDDLLKWLIENVDTKLHDSIQKCIDRKSSKKASQVIEWLPYSSRFQYVFSKDLTEKPRWI